MVVLLLNGYTILEAARQLVPWSRSYDKAIHTFVAKKRLEAQDFRFLNTLEPFLAELMVEMLVKTNITVLDVYSHFEISLDEVDVVPPGVV